MATNSVTITYKDLSINFRCYNVICHEITTEVIFKSKEDAKDFELYLKHLEIPYTIVECDNAIIIDVATKRLIVSNENAQDSSDNLVTELINIKKANDRINLIINKFDSCLTLMESCNRKITKTNWINDDVKSLANTINNNINEVKVKCLKLLAKLKYEHPTFKSNDILLSSQFNRYTFESIVKIHVYLKYQDEVPEVFTIFSKATCYVSKDVLDAIKSISEDAFDVMTFAATKFIENNKEAQTIVNVLLKQWWK